MVKDLPINKWLKVLAFEKTPNKGAIDFGIDLEVEQKIRFRPLAETYVCCEVNAEWPQSEFWRSFIGTLKDNRIDGFVFLTHQGGLDLHSFTVQMDKGKVRFELDEPPHAKPKVLYHQGVWHGDE